MFYRSYAFLVCGAFYVNGIRADDVVYVPLPLHHSAGGVVGSGQSLFFGCTVVLRSKFSASAFWTDTIQHQCTVGQPFDLLSNHSALCFLRSFLCASSA